MGRKKPVSHDEDVTDLSEDHAAEVMQVAPAKDKGKKKKKSKNSWKDNDEDVDDNVLQGDGGDVTKKLNLTKNGNNSRFTASAFELLGDDGESPGFKIRMVMVSLVRQMVILL